MRQREVTKRGRQRAIGIARSMDLNNTVRLIVEGETSNWVRIAATNEYMKLHKYCPCCHGLESTARIQAGYVVENMFDEF